MYAKIQKSYSLKFKHWTKDKTGLFLQRKKNVIIDIVISINNDFTFRDYKAQNIVLFVDHCLAYIIFSNKLYGSV